MNRYIKLLISLPKTLWYNIKCFGIIGIKMPILVAYNAKSLGGVKIPQDARRWDIKLGFNEGSYAATKEERGGLIQISPSGKIIFEGKCDIKPGRMKRRFF